VARRALPSLRLRALPRVAACALVLLAPPVAASAAEAAADAPAVDSGEVMTERPTAPAGFHWYGHEATRAEFLVPDGWFVRDIDQGGTVGFAISQQEIKTETDTFDTGLTVNAFRGSDAADQDPAAHGEAWMKALLGMASGQAEIHGVEFGPFRGNAFSVRVSAKASPDGQAFNMEAFYLVNTDTKALYLVWFEAPAKSWQKAWTAGSEIMGMFAFDTEW